MSWKPQPCPECGEWNSNPRRKKRCKKCNMLRIKTKRVTKVIPEGPPLADL